jgi:hypothetical protein
MVLLRSYNGGLLRFILTFCHNPRYAYIVVPTYRNDSMAVRKRTWKTAGSTSEAWVVDYRAHDPLTGKVSRHWETYEKKRDADAREAQIKKDTRKGTHIALSA